jgi:hypothetical protein
MDRQELIDEFSELLNIPQFENIIVHKINELKLMFKDDIDLYLNLKRTYEGAGDNLMKVCENSENERDITYRFELNLNEEGKWVPSNITPSPPSYCGKFDIIPLAVIQHICSYQPDPAKIVKIKEYSHSELENKKFEVSFTRYSHHHVFGTICELKEKDSHDPAKCPPNVIDITDSFDMDSEAGKYREFLNYMKKFPKYRDHVFSEFFMKWKLLIDNQIIDARTIDG